MKESVRIGPREVLELMKLRLGWAPWKASGMAGSRHTAVPLEVVPFPSFSDHSHWLGQHASGCLTDLSFAQAAEQTTKRVKWSLAGLGTTLWGSWQGMEGVQL